MKTIEQLNGERKQLLVLREWLVDKLHRVDNDLLNSQKEIENILFEMNNEYSN